MLQVQIIGSGGSAPPPGYGGPSILIDTGSTRVILDCGENCVSTLGKLGRDPCRIDYVYISHIHIDHWAGLPGLAVKLVERGCPRLTVLAHEEVAASLNNYLSTFMPSSVVYELKEVENEEIDMGGYTGKLFKTIHKVPTYGVVFTDKKNGEVKLVYTSDTGYTGSIKELVQSSPKALIADTTLPTRMIDVAVKTGHMTVSQVLELAGEIDSDITIAFHLTESSLKELMESMPKGLIIPRDGMAFNI